MLKPAMDTKHHGQQGSDPSRLFLLLLCLLLNPSPPPSLRVLSGLHAPVMGLSTTTLSRRPVGARRTLATADTLKPGEDVIVTCHVTTSHRRRRSDGSCN